MHTPVRLPCSALRFALPGSCIMIVAAGGSYGKWWICSCCSQILLRRLLHIIAIDESYLVRRVRATILGRLQQAPEAVQAVVRLHAVHAGQRSFRDLVAMHRGSAQAVIHLL